MTKPNDETSGNSARNISAQLEIRRETIYPSRMNPRKNFDDEAMRDLAASIREHGIIEPIVVRPDDHWFIVEGKLNGKPAWFCYDDRFVILASLLGKGESYKKDASYFSYNSRDEAEELMPRWEIIAGERRWRAAKLAGLDMIPVRIINDIDDRRALELALIENLCRRDIDPIEEAYGYATLRDMGHKVIDIADKVNRSQPAVSNALRLLDLPKDVQGKIATKDLSVSHGRALASFVDYPKMFEYKLKLALTGTPTKIIEKVDYDWAAENAGALAAISTAKIGVDAAKECLKCIHRRERSFGDGWLCLNVECFKAKADALQQQKLADIKAQYGFAPDEEIPNIDSIITSVVCLYDHGFPPGCRDDCEHRSIAIAGANIQKVCRNPECFEQLKSALEHQKREESASIRAQDETARAELVKKIFETIDEPRNANKLIAIAIFQTLHEINDLCLADAGKQMGIDLDWEVFFDAYSDAENDISSLEQLSLIPWPRLIALVAAAVLLDYLRHGGDDTVHWFLEESIHKEQGIGGDMPVPCDHYVEPPVDNPDCAGCAKVVEDNGFVESLPLCKRCGEQCFEVYRSRLWQDKTYCSERCVEIADGVSHIVHISIEEGIKHGVKDCDDIEILREALALEEKASQPRKGLVKALQSKINRLHLGKQIPDVTPNKDATTYHDNAGVVYFVSSGISGGEGWMTVRRSSPKKGTHRVVSPSLSLRDTKEQAQADLDAYAKKRGWRILKETSA